MGWKLLHVYWILWNSWACIDRNIHLIIFLNRLNWVFYRNVRFCCESFVIADILQLVLMKFTDQWYCSQWISGRHLLTVIHSRLGLAVWFESLFSVVRILVSLVSSLDNFWKRNLCILWPDLIFWALLCSNNIVMKFRLVLHRKLPLLFFFEFLNFLVLLSFVFLFPIFQFMFIFNLLFLLDFLESFLVN